MSYELDSIESMTTFTTEDREIAEKELITHLDKTLSNLFGTESQFIPKPNPHQDKIESISMGTPQLLKDIS